ncbi:hypothetical protein CRE_00790 [Caenorhabditis remanei]|uniref:C2H2-type domain-containing protein n=1 Tax=Caenorhabditis remanei TaxID=31234 RepID=E3LEC0_CAERE|nr:hypothetical protein CRE_00790 [Caenorhabditis remanei]
MPLGTRAQTRKKRDREEEDDDGQSKPPEFKRHNSKNSEVENLEDQGIEEERLIQQQNQQPSSSRRIPSVEERGSDLNLRSSLLSVNQFESLSQRSRNRVEGEGEEQTGNRKELELSKFQAILNADGHRLKIVVEEAGSEPNDILKVSFFQISCTIPIKCLKCETQCKNTDELAQHYLADHANQEQKDYVALYNCFEREMWQDLERSINNQRMETFVIKRFVVTRKFVLRIPFDSDIVPYVLPTETKVFLHSCPTGTKYFFQTALTRKSNVVQVYFVFDDHVKPQTFARRARVEKILKIFQEIEGYSVEQLISLTQEDRAGLIELLEGQSNNRLRKEKKEFNRDLLSRLQAIGNAKRMNPVQIKEAIEKGSPGFEKQDIQPIHMRKKQTANPAVEPTDTPQTKETSKPKDQKKAKPANQKTAKTGIQKQVAPVAKKTATKTAPKRESSGPQKQSASSKKSKK